MMRSNPVRCAFTLLELLVVVAIVAILAGILLPALSRSRVRAKTTVCSSRLRTLGQGVAMYANEYEDKLLPGRMPKIDDEHWQIDIEGGVKYRPTFIAIMGSQIGVPPFADPKPRRDELDRDGERGDRQNYVNEAYVCPEVASWTDERNGCYGYNYQFLGNARLRDEADQRSFKNWPRTYSRVRSPGKTVAVGDSMGTAAAFKPTEREGYDNNGRGVSARGNEGFNLDPPALDVVEGEVAAHEEEARSAADPRHIDKTNVLWLDGHVTTETLKALGYVLEEDKRVGNTGDNRLWTSDQRHRIWLMR